MNRKLRRWVALSLVIGTGAFFSCSPTPDDGNGGPDGSTDDGAGDVADTGTDAPADAGADAGADANADAADAGDDAADAGDDADAALPDGGLRFVVVSCTLIAPAPNANAQWIASDGKRYRLSGLLPAPKAGAVIGATGTPIATLSPDDLAELLAAAQTLDSSAAGTTTTTGPTQHMTTRNGKLYSAGAAGNPEILVLSLVDGASAGQRTVISHNDPAADVVRKYGCFIGE